MAESNNTSVLITGILALLTAVLGTLVKGCSDDNTANKLASQKLYSDMILKTLEPADPMARLHGLQLLIATNLIHDDNISNGVERYAKAMATTPERIPQTAVAGATPALGTPMTNNARIYLLTGNPKNTAALAELRQPIEKAGFPILNARYLNDPGRPSYGEVRYFFSVDKPQAKRLAEFLRVQLNQPKLVDSLYQDLRVSPGYLEIWTGK